MSDASKRALSLESYHVLRGQIEHEDQLINHRLSWLVSAQSFLLTAYAITLNAPVQFSIPAYEKLNRILFRLLPLSGLAVVTLIYLTIIAAILALLRLRALADGELPGGLPPIHGHRGTMWLGLIGPLLIPCVFAVVWIVLALNGAGL